MAAKEVTAKRRTSAKRRPPAKKAAPSKASSKTGAKNKPRTASKPPVKKAVAKKTAPAKGKGAVRKPPTKKAAPKSSGTRGGFKRELDEHGFVPGTDSAHIAAALLAGGKDRNEINAKVLKKIGGETRTGSEKNIPALVSGVLNRLLEQGYKIESSWTLVAPARKRKVAKK